MEINKFEKKKPYNKFLLKIIAVIFLVVLGIFVVKIKGFKKDTSSNNVLSATSNLKPSSIPSDNVGKYVNQTQNEIKQSANNIIGEATQYTVNLATQSATAIEDTLFQNTIGKLVDQVNKLPTREKEEIKKEICK